MSFLPWDKPAPEAELGLKAEMLYGQALDFKFGASHETVIGPKCEIALSPGVLVKELLRQIPGLKKLVPAEGDSPKNPALDGVSGAVDFTIGPKLDFTWGREYEIHLGPKKYEVDIDEAMTEKMKFVKTMCATIGVTSLVYFISYALAGTDEEACAILAVTYQVLINTLVASLMSGIAFHKHFARDEHGKWRAQFDARLWIHSEFLEAWKGDYLSTGLLAYAVSAPVVTAITEGHFDGDPQSA